MFSSLNPFTTSDNASSSTQKEASLTTILPTPTARSDLTLLLGTITASMRDSIESTFTANLSASSSADQSDPSTSPQQPQQPKRPTSGSSPSSSSTNPAEKKKKKEADERAWIDAVKADIAAQEKVRLELEKRRKELSTERMVEMRKAALGGFDAWRERVMERVGEVVNARAAGAAGEEGGEGKAQGQQAAGRGGGAAVAGGKDVDVADPKAKEAIAAKRDAEAVRAGLERAYPATDTPLVGLEEEKRALILHSMLLLLLSLESYPSWSRTLMLHLTTSLDLPLRLLEEDEAKIATGLLQAVDMSGESSTKKAAEDNATARKWKVGLATVAGAAIVGITGGLAAPLLAAGVGSVMGGLGLGATATAGYLGTLAGSSVLVGGLFGAYGGKMTGEMMDAYAKEVEDFGFVPVRSAPIDGKDGKEDVKAKRRLRVTVGVSGWLSSADDVHRPWKVLGPLSAETFALRFELNALLALGSALTSLLKSAAWSYAKSEIIKRTVFASLTAALWPLALLKVSRVIDNPFSVAKARADKAGEVLADAIINKAQGERPVTLVGYSLGARVIFICLKKMAERGAFGLVEDVVLIGAATPSDALDWRIVRAVASGRVVNVYSKEDYILGFLYRSSSVQLGIAGLQPVEGVQDVENVDFSTEVQGHNSWRYLVGKVLTRVGFSDLVEEEIAKQQRDLKKAKQDEEASREQAEKDEQKTTANEEAEAKGPADATIQNMSSSVEQHSQQATAEAKTEKMKIEDGRVAGVEKTG